jgi:hypothetical protein
MGAAAADRMFRARNIRAGTAGRSVMPVPGELFGMHVCALRPRCAPIGGMSYPAPLVEDRTRGVIGTVRPGACRGSGARRSAVDRAKKPAGPDCPGPAA